MLKKNNILLTLLLISLRLVSQDTLLFLQNDSNYITNTKCLTPFFKKLYTLEQDNAGQVNILHIGDSHLQAAFLTERMKKNLANSISPTDTVLAPGFIFPYSIANTNNPSYYHVLYSGSWMGCRSPKTLENCTYGLSGITIKTDSLAHLKIKFNTKYSINRHEFNSVQIIHQADPSLTIRSDNWTRLNNNIPYITSFYRNNITDSVELEISPGLNPFECYGFIFSNDKPGIIYNTIGVNGASAKSYLKCTLFSSHLNLFHPDLIILSLGTNDAYDKEFELSETISYFKSLLDTIHKVHPSSPVLISISGDFVDQHKMPSTENAMIQKALLKLVNERNLSSWNFYEIMGGERSIQDWYKHGLSSKDKIHLTKQGYYLKGDLFSKAILDAYIQYKNSIPNKD